MTDLTTRVLAALHKIAPDVEPASVDVHRPLRDQLDLDSMDYLNFLAALSSEHGVAISEADAQQLSSIEDVVRFLAR